MSYDVVQGPRRGTKAALGGYSGAAVVLISPSRTRPSHVMTISDLEKVRKSTWGGRKSAPKGSESS